jgi:hypothetical protein
MRLVPCEKKVDVFGCRGAGDGSQRFVRVQFGSENEQLPTEDSALEMNDHLESKLCDLFL